MQYWLLKTEPEVYTYADLAHDGTTTWDGVTNNLALKHIRTMQPGDKALIYHTGDERRIVGVAEIASAPFSDPQAVDPKIVVVDVRAVALLAQPVTLAQIKADPFFADFALVRMGRLSIVPVTPEQWERLIGLGNP